MATQMPEVQGAYGDLPVIVFPEGEAPKGLKVVELEEGNGPMVRRGDTVTVNYHGQVWGNDTAFDSSFERHQPASFGIGVGQVIKGWDQTVPGHNVGSVCSYRFRLSMAMARVVCRRPALAPMTHWSSSSTSSPRADWHCTERRRAPAGDGRCSIVMG